MLKHGGLSESGLNKRLNKRLDKRLDKRLGKKLGKKPGKRLIKSSRNDQRVYLRNEEHKI
ncbi:MAG: hypothetical protein GX833_04515 [Clostridium sp.]|nr:hypothetical protein [Clostridium sp.]